ncbi:MAG: HAD-IA family hydrolase [Elusimicrobia bacterium]|nr:HAD-IA family hydrolase [Elusimicrobiota bacterium]
MSAVVFDMDGVAIDSEAHWRGVETESLLRHLTPGAALDHKRLMGLSMEGFHRALSADYGLAMSYAEFVLLYRDMARRIYEERCALMPGFLELLEASRAAGLKVALASSSPDEWVDLIVDRFDLRARLHAVVSADRVGGKGKPAPDVYLEAMRRLGLAPRAGVGIEDSRNGLLSAHAAGLACVALRNGFNDEQDLSAAELEVLSLRELDPERLRRLAAERG